MLYAIFIQKTAYNFFQAKNMLYKKNFEFDTLPLALKRVRKISWKIRTSCLCFGDNECILSISYCNTVRMTALLQ